MGGFLHGALFQQAWERKRMFSEGKRKERRSGLPGKAFSVKENQLMGKSPGEQFADACVKSSTLVDWDWYLQNAGGCILPWGSGQFAATCHAANLWPVALWAYTIREPRQELRPASTCLSYALLYTGLRSDEAGTHWALNCSLSLGIHMRRLPRHAAGTFSRIFFLRDTL